MKQKGFTLIELLAVIGILSVLALVTTPIVINIIRDSRKDAFVDSAYAIIEATRDYRMNAIANKTSRALTINYASNTNTAALKTTGKLPDAGNLNMDKDGNIELALWSDSAKACAAKKKTDSKVTIQKDVTKANCNTTYTNAH